MFGLFLDLLPSNWHNQHHLSQYQLTLITLLVNSYWMFIPQHRYKLPDDSFKPRRIERSREDGQTNTVGQPLLNKYIFVKQEYFRTTSEWSSKILTKLTGKRPSWRRTIWAGTYNVLPDMEWLDTYTDTETKTKIVTNQMDQDNGSSAVDHMEWQ